jgi:hypothetical protein
MTTMTADIDDDPYDGEEGDGACTHCGGDIWVECDDPIQCTYPSCDGELHMDPACNFTGKASEQWLF